MSYLNRVIFWIRRRAYALRLIRPRLRPGDEIHRQAGTQSGTLGPFIVHDRRLHALTCEHVVFNPTERAEPGGVIRAQSRDDAARDLGSRDIGKVQAWGQIDYRAGLASIDAARIAISYPRVHLPPYGLNEPVTSVLDVDAHGIPLDLRVAKAGAATGVSHGLANGILNVKSFVHGGHSFELRGVIEVAGDEDGYRDWMFCDEGDSGGLVWTSDPPVQALGLLVSDNLTHRGYVLPMNRILGYFNARLATHADLKETLK